jgi:hypothetical protein
MIFMLKNISKNCKNIFKVAFNVAFGKSTICLFYYYFAQFKNVGFMLVGKHSHLLI